MWDIQHLAIHLSVHSSIESALRVEHRDSVTIPMMMAKISKMALLLLAWLTIAANPLFRDRWICDKTWLRLTTARYPNLENVGVIDVKALAKTLKNRAGPFEAAANVDGLYHKQFKHKCPYDTDEGSTKRRMVHYFYQDSKGISPIPPRCAADITDPYVKCAQMVERRFEVSRNRANAEREREVEAQIRQCVMDKVEEESKKKESERKKEAEAEEEKQKADATVSPDGKSSSAVPVTPDPKTNRTHAARDSIEKCLLRIARNGRLRIRRRTN